MAQSMLDFGPIIQLAQLSQNMERIILPAHYFFLRFLPSGPM